MNTRVVASPDPALHLNPRNLIDWGVVDNLTSRRWGGKATWWVQATPGVNYYRAEMPAKHLGGKTVRLNESDVVVENNPSGGERIVFRRQEGAAVWMFPGNVTRWLLMAEMRNQGVPVWVEVDDNYTVPVGISLAPSGWLTTRDRSGGDKPSYECHRAIVRSSACDGVIVSTPRLADVYLPLNSNIAVCRNSVDPDDWPENPPHRENGVLHIGWAGSASHIADLNDIRRALDYASRQRNVQVVLFGQLSFPFEHKQIMWTDSLDEYRRKVSDIDVMLCPLRPSPWADCKSDVKALEAAMAGACPVVSKTEPYRPWWGGEAEGGFVAGSPKEFLKIVKHLVAHPEEARQAAEAARKYVIGKRNIRSTVSAWCDALS